jgi:hypothetical protein
VSTDTIIAENILIRCQRKKRFATKAEAKEANGNNWTMSVYRCLVCEGYHLGHDRRKPGGLKVGEPRRPSAPKHKARKHKDRRR